MIDCGNGIPIVLIPGLQGRWEWMRPAVTALAKHNRVLSFSLCDERTSPFPCDPAKAFENYISQVEMALDRARIDRAVIAGVSYGGLIATEFAARNPDRVSGLVLANALHASWQPNSTATALPGFADPVGPDVSCRRRCTRAGGTARRPADLRRADALYRGPGHAGRPGAGLARENGAAHRVGAGASIRGCATASRPRR